MPNSWNLTLAQTLKEIVFNANLPIFLLLICVILSWKYNIKKRIKYILTFTFVLFFVFCFHYTPLFLSSLLLRQEEKIFDSKYNPRMQNTLIQIPECIHNIKGIVVLGAGISYTNTPSFNGLIRLYGLSELLKESKSIQIWRKNKIPIILSGGYTNPDFDQSEAEAMKNYAKLLFANELSQLNIVTENGSKNTYQNAYFTEQFFSKRKIEKNIILITNTFHMRRAQKTFQAQGFNVCPAPVVSKSLEGEGFLNFSNATKTVFFLNEYFGIAGYYIKGWI